MEGTGKGNDSIASGGGASDLDGIFDGFGPGRKEDGLGRTFYRRQGIEPFCKLNIGFIGHDLEGSMGKGLQLRLDGGYYLRVAMAGIQNGDAAGEIDIAPAISIPDFSIFCAHRKDGRRSRNTARYGGFPATHEVCVTGGRRVGIHGVSPKYGQVWGFVRPRWLAVRSFWFDVEI